MENSAAEGASKRFLTVKEAADLLRLKPGTLYQYAERRKMPHLKVGGRLLFDEAELTEWVDRHRVPEAAGRVLADKK